ncbi:MAG: hypothetical protein SH857_07715 [Chitinophagales bacterium]|nr:hypothetical protein [Chitinophagales bacterium]
MSNGESKNQTYIVKEITAQFENDGVRSSLLIKFPVRNSYGKFILYVVDKDSLIMKFEEGTTESIAINKTPGLSGKGPSIICKLPYGLNDSVKKAFQSGKKIVALRITSKSFNIDISSLETSLSQKFKECWIE